MKWILFLVLSTIFVCNTTAQKQMKLKINEIESQIHIASNKSHKIYISPPERQNSLKSGLTTKAEILVKYINFPDEAKQAFEYASSIWENLISSPVPIRITAEWSDPLNINIMASARPTAFYSSTNENTLPDVLYPVSLFEKISGKEVNNEEPDIYCSFNKNISWYFGTDGNTPVSQYDFTTAVLHEITHGLGFAGFLKNIDGQGVINNPSNLPSIYDHYLFNAARQQITNKTIFPDASEELAKQLTSDEVIFFRCDNKYGDEKTIDNVYAPKIWKDGASIFHLNETATDEDRLMTAFARKGEAIHNPGGTVLEILSEIGWNSVHFTFEKPTDKENFCPEIALNLTIRSDVPFDSSSVKVIYSANHFETQKMVALDFDQSTGQFIVNVPIETESSSFQYYFCLGTPDDKMYTFPEMATEKPFTFNVGPDNLPPSLQHNPVKLIAKSASTLNLSAVVIDNIGVNSVKVEYKINGTLQNPLQLSNVSEDIFMLDLPLSSQLDEKSKVEYRIIAEDNSVKRNKKILPSTGFYPVEIFNANNPVVSYHSDFDTENTDFVSNDFVVSRQPGFYSGILQTCHPYPLSSFENEKYNLIAQLRSPIILQRNGKMSYSEVVLVEPGLAATASTGPFLWDFVVVEGSKNDGISWQPFKNEYDSQIKDSWQRLFNNSIANGCSYGVPEESMLAEHEIALTENEFFSAGDTVLIRFRLASDQTINGWGWAIDNLKIQYLSTANNELAAQDDYTIYPNPFSNIIYIDRLTATNFYDVKIMLTDIMGRMVFSETWLNNSSITRKQLNLPDLKTGIYMLSIIENNSTRITKKIIKN